MSKISALVRRELAAFFVSPMAYIVLTVFLVITAMVFGFGQRFFSVPIEKFSFGAIGALLNLMSVMLLFLVPLLTMRLLSEEVSSGTIETLMTAPVSNTAVVLSKFFGAFGFVVVMLLPTLVFPIALYAIAGGAKPDTGPMVSGYFGLLLLAMTVVAVGVWVSACVRNQISAAVITALVLGLSWFGGSATSGKAVAAWEKIARYLGVLYHYESFSKGMIDTRDVVFFITTTALFLFAAVGVVAVRRWR
jgi:gliding motility-associated transport system permease protein